MEKYDSSIETLKHIKRVAYYINIIQKELNNSMINGYDTKTGINDATLVDLLVLLLNGENLPSYSKLFNDINNNSRNYKLGNKYTDKDKLLCMYLDELIDRELHHDRTKLEEPEKHYFDLWTPHIQEGELGTVKYEEFLEKLAPALEHHYRCNRHHPEHFGNGIYGMTIMDLTELLCDWCATDDRHANTNIYKSIDILSNRFNYSTPMIKVLSNTCERYLKGK